MGHQKMHQKSYSNHKNRRKIRIFIYQTCENWIFYRPGSHFWSLKSIKNQNKVETNLTFSPILHKFQSNNGEKREKSNSAKIWALLLFSSLFSRLLFSSKIQMIFATLMQDLYLPRHMACCCGIKMQFLRKKFK
jgi:hypothetical protein